MALNLPDEVTYKGLNKAQVFLTNMFAKGKQQKELADMLGTSQGTISRIYGGYVTKGNIYDAVVAYADIQHLLNKRKIDDNKLDLVMTVVGTLIVLATFLYVILVH